MNIYLLDGSSICMENKRMDLHTKGGYIFLLKLSCQMTLDKGSFTSTTITNQHQFEGGHILFCCHSGGGLGLVLKKINKYYHKTTIHCLQQTFQIKSKTVHKCTKTKWPKFDYLLTPHQSREHFHKGRKLTVKVIICC